ncbi:threonylcarbamoyl-AMP synthase [Candidatus Peregrinibacteria bacterium]|nr:threonylcarbamoyl-AMP synthase [Candidatus Peregrinibacteria bacterium]
MNENIFEAVKTLRAGGVVAHATETCYGLAADIFMKSAIQKLYALKKMSRDKPVSILLRSFDEAQEYAEFSPLALQLALKYWPGPLTLVLPAKPIVPNWINAGNATVGIRVSSNAMTRKLLEAFGGGITTTSANISGMPPAYCVQDFLDQKLLPDFILDSGKIGAHLPSTIVEVTGCEYRVIRQGGLKIG